MMVSKLEHKSKSTCTIVYLSNFIVVYIELSSLRHIYVRYKTVENL